MAGEFATVLFAAGLVAASFCAACVLPRRDVRPRFARRSVGSAAPTAAGMRRRCTAASSR
ncbi:MAG: hypothetical protein ACLTSX_10565 [Collinsella sp.]